MMNPPEGSRHEMAVAVQEPWSNYKADLNRQHTSIYVVAFSAILRGEAERAEAIARYAGSSTSLGRGVFLRLGAM
jgi:hypothetical protein